MWPDSGSRHFRQQFQLVSFYLLSWLHVLHTVWRLIMIKQGSFLSFCFSNAADLRSRCPSGSRCVAVHDLCLLVCSKKFIKIPTSAFKCHRVKSPFLIPGEFTIKSTNEPRASGRHNTHIGRHKYWPRTSCRADLTPQMIHYVDKTLNEHQRDTCLLPKPSQPSHTGHNLKRT